MWSLTVGSSRGKSERVWEGSSNPIWGRGSGGGAGAVPKEEAKWMDLDRAPRRPLSFL